jgi:opacity protein-like surface antigen
MKRFFILLFISVCFLGTTQVKSQSIEKGKIIIDAYYGWPNMWTSFLKTTLDPAGTNIKVGSLGPFGGRLEFLLSDKVGIGIDIHSATSSVSWNATDSLSSVNYDYKVSVNRLRICPRINYHFNSNENLDFYGAFGIGYKNSNVKVTTSDPDYNENSFSITMTPVTWRAAIGIRYFFTENIGANLEMGLGGVLATGGISFKF